MAGETGPITDTVSLSISMVIAGLFAISVYNSLEIYISIYRTFRRRQGLYFWSAICANTGIPILSISSLLRFFALAPTGPMSIVIDIGWWMMVTGQSLMVYSRLHLVIGDLRKLRWLLCMVIGMFLFVQVPVGALFIANSYYGRSNVETRINIVFDGIEKTQLVVLSLQEAILSGLYVYEWANMRKQIEITKGHKVRIVFHELVTLFVVVVALDISLIIIQFANLFEIQVTYKPVVYSIKLKVETFVLNNLVELVSSSGNGLELPSDLMTMDTAAHDDDPWRSRRTPSLGASGASLSTTSAGKSSMLPVLKKRVSI